MTRYFYDVYIYDYLMNEKALPKLSYMVSHLVWFSNPNLASCHQPSFSLKKNKKKQNRIAREVLLPWPNTVAATAASSSACSRCRVLVRLLLTPPDHLLLQSSRNFLSAHFLSFKTNGYIYFSHFSLFLYSFSPISLFLISSHIQTYT
jgi:hypothetical protein